MSEFRGRVIRDDDTHFSVLNNYALQQLKLSYRSATNETSNLLLKEVWNSNAKLFNDEAMSNIANSAKELFKNTDISHNNWSSTISKVDAVTLFEKSTQDCRNCSDSNFQTNNFDGFLKEECKCNLEIPEKSEQNLEPKTGNISTKNFNSESSQESGDEKIFRPKFARQRVTNKSKQSKLEIVDSHIKILKNKEDKESNLEPWKPSPAPMKYTNSKEPAMDVDVDENNVNKSSFVKTTFKTAKEQLLATNPAAKRTLGASRKAQGKFVSPMIGAQEKQETNEPVITDERLKNIDPKMIELIESEIIDKGTPISWEDIAGLQLAKSVIQEAVVWPLLRPDIFTGLRRPPKGILLFGPPGTGKTLIGKCVAAQCKATFFSISASSLTSKWIGDGEKMVRALFAVARCHQPAVIFIDEIDSLLTQRNDSEHEATRRIKTEFLVQFDGAAIGDEDRILIVGATNRPQELDEAARRRLVKRLYIPLPDVNARKQIISNLLKNEINELNIKDIDEVAGLTEGYSGADMKSLCSEAAMGPVRDLPLSQIATIHRDNVRPVCAQDFIQALQRVRPSVSQDDLGQYVKWNQTYGQGF